MATSRVNGQPHAELPAQTNPVTDGRAAADAECQPDHRADPTSIIATRNASLSHDDPTKHDPPRKGEPERRGRQAVDAVGGGGAG